MRQRLSQRLDDVPVWAIALLGAAAFVLVPWSVALTAELPAHHVARHWDVAWAGFDAGIAVALLATVAAAVRRSAWLAVIAGGAAAMLLCDAWFDIVTSSDQLDLWLAVAAAVARGATAGRLSASWSRTVPFPRASAVRRDDSLPGTTRIEVAQLATSARRDRPAGYDWASA